MTRPPTRSTLFPYTTLFRSIRFAAAAGCTFATLPGQGKTQDPGNALLCGRSEEHTSELQSHSDLVCRLLLEKRKLDWAVITPSGSDTHKCPEHAYVRQRAAL